MAAVVITRFPRSPADLALSVRVAPGETYARSQVLLARVNLRGTLELLTAAWARVLGYDRGELNGRTLSQLMWPGRAAAAVAAILDLAHMEPVELRLRCRNAHGKTFRLHRRVDSHDRRIFIVAEELNDEHSGERRLVAERRTASRGLAPTRRPTPQSSSSPP